MNSPHGFSLLEVIVALGLFIVVIMGVTQLFPMLQRRAAQSELLAQAPLIAQSIFSTLEASTPDGVIATGPDWLTNPDHSLYSVFSKLQRSQFYVGYDATGQPVCSLTKEEYEAPLQKKGINSAVVITLSKEKQPSDIIHATVTITTPMILPEKKRKHLELIRTYYCSTD